jgi:hypothetical protein
MTADDVLPFPERVRAHSIWAASASERWFACPGSIKLIGGEESTSSRYAREGTVMHTIAEQCLRPGANRVPADYVSDVMDDDIEVTDEFAEAVQLYLDTIRADQDWDGGELLVERKFDLSDVWPGLFGTNDAMLISDNLLRVYDYKGGKGIAVEVEGNTQELIYAVGAFYDLRFLYDFEWIELVIVQPRCPHRHGPVRRWRLHVSELRTFIEVLKDKLSATMDPDAPLVAGDHCIFCPARPRCPALRDYALAQARMDFADAPPMPNLLTPDEIAALLPKVELMDEWVRAVKAHAKALAEGGTRIPGWKLVPKRAMRHWRLPVDQTMAYLARYGLTPKQMLTEPELRSPAQIEKMLKPPQRNLVKPPKGDTTTFTLVEARSSGTNFVPEVDMRGNVAAQVEQDFKPLA